MLFSFDVNFCGQIRVQRKLSSGEITVCGDQWPLLVYEDYKYDPEEPWNGLFRSQLLVWVSCTYFFVTYTSYCEVGRHTNTSSPHPAPLKRKRRQQDQAMLVYMV